MRPELGGSHDLKEFIDTAAGLNMSVLLDIVWNHASGDSALVNVNYQSNPPVVCQWLIDRL